MNQVDVIRDVCQLEEGLTGQRVSQQLGQPSVPGGGQHQGQGGHQGRYKTHLENYRKPQEPRVRQRVRRVRHEAQFGLCTAKSG